MTGYPTRQQYCPQMARLAGSRSSPLPARCLGAALLLNLEQDFQP